MSVLLDVIYPCRCYEKAGVVNFCKATQCQQNNPSRKDTIALQSASTGIERSPFFELDSTTLQREVTVYTYTHISKIYGLVIILFAILSPAHAAVVSLNPLQAGVYTGGDGVSSRWVQVTSEWNGQYGIEQFADYAVVMAMPAGDPNILRSLEANVSTINFSDGVYRSQWEPSWSLVGGTTPAPLFPANDANQEDYAVSFSGFIAVTTPGEYNFGVLFDDAFRFTLTGANGASYTIFKDGLNPRDRVGFGSDFALGAGLYQFSLSSYEHLEASVIGLSWWYPGGTKDPVIIPQSHLFSALPPMSIPEPKVWLLFMAGLLALAWNFRKNLIVAPDFSSHA